MNRGDALSAAKTGYVNVLRSTGKVLTRKGAPPPSRDRKFRHWAHSLTLIHDSLAIATLDVPWWTYKGIDAVEHWLENRQRPIRVFEYGSGASTFWLSKRTDEIQTVEHHRRFAEHIGPKLAELPNVTLHIVEPVKSDNPIVSSKKEGNAGLDFAGYVGTIDEVGGEFDLVVIDGRARESCLTAALPHLAPGGLIIFDNTRRKRYRDAIAAADVTERRFGGLTPTLPYPDRTSLLTLSRPSPAGTP